MKFDINNPAFLQAAGAISASKISIYYTSETLHVINAYSLTPVKVTCFVNNEEINFTVEPVDGFVSIEIPAGYATARGVVLSGKITELVDYDEFDIYSSVYSLNIEDASSLMAIDFGTPDSIEEFTVRADKEDLANDIAEIIANAGASNGSVYLRNRTDKYNQIIIDAALNKGWDYDYL